MTGSAEALFLLVRHSAKDRAGGLPSKAMRDAELLKRDMESSILLRGACLGVVSSTNTAALDTARLLTGDGCVIPLIEEKGMDEQSIGGHGSGSDLMLQIERVLRKYVALSAPGHAKGFTVLVAGPRWVVRCARLFGQQTHGRSKGGRLDPVQGGCWLLSFPCPGWRCETIDDYKIMMQTKEGKLMDDVFVKWKNRPSRVWGEGEVMWRDRDWVVRKDVWKMDHWGRHGDTHGDSGDLMPLVACATHLGLKCIRDLQHDHLDALVNLDRRFPDADGWIKYLLYPPYVWRLHVHIQKKGTPMPCFNVFRLEEVLDMLSNLNPSINRPLTIHSTLLVHDFHR